ncbi:MAG: hypothetical protein EP335_04420 [Alphaproteobacteria bacterium]|nr:MAG: hypothetical protein EP335_04420 [Alphaproteobacteria bacterium]
MPAEKRRHSLSETGLVLALVLIALAPASLRSGIGALMAALHLLSLMGLYLLLRQLADRLHAWAGHLLFGLATLLLAAEIAVQAATGLHLNRFVLSLLVQPQALDQIGLSPVMFWAATGAALVLPSILLWRTRRAGFRLPARAALLGLLVGAAGTQAIYTAAYFQGSTGAVEARRLLPFFDPVPPYYSRRALGLLFGLDTGNAFALPQQGAARQAQAMPAPSFSLAQDRDVLLVIADSLRAGDIRRDPTLAPNLMRWATRGSLSLDHYSTSNCTHFSFYSMLTGKLPTGFGRAREQGSIPALPAMLAMGGFRLTSTESLSLDWYDTAGILMDGTARTITDTAGQEENDRAVTDDTLAALAADGPRPRFHLAYYQGTHYPYGDSPDGSDYERYLASIRRFDAELGRLLEGLEVAGRLAHTLVIVTSDHGDDFTPDGSAIGHSSLMSDGQVQVPFLVLGGTVPAPRSHMGLTPYVLANLGGPAAAPGRDPVILANCDYAYPNGFALLLPEGRADFAFDDGELVPVHGPDGTMAPASLSYRTASLLLAAIERDR